jgi:Tfp pilus assembly PilM family ATPase
VDTLGIDIGTTTVKYVRYRKRTDRIVSHGEYRYRKGWEELRDILSAIKDKEGTNIALAVGITSVDLHKKTYSVPVLPEQEMKAEVDALVSKSMFVPLDDMRRQYLMLGETEEWGTVKQDVLFLGAHSSFVDHVVSLFHKTGFKRLLALTDVGFGYQSMTDCALDGAVAVADIGGRQTGIYIIDSGKLLLIRDVMTACEILKDAVVGGTALSPDEAEDHLWMNGFGEMSENSMLTLPLERLAAQIQRTFLVYSQKYPKRPIAKAWVSGRGAKIPGLPEKLSELLGQQFDVLPSRAEVDQQYIPAYALATRSDKFPNLLAEGTTDMARHAAVTRYARAVGIIIVSGIALFSLASWARLQFLKTSVDSRLSVLSQKRQLLTGYNPNQQTAPGRMQTSFKEMGQRETSFVRLLKYLSFHLPKQVYLKSIEFDADRTTTAKTAGNDAGNGGMKTQPGSEEARRIGTMHLRGYVITEGEGAEPVLTQVVVNLKKSGFLTNVKVAQEGMRNVKGKMVMEFMASGECRGYEI